MLNKSQGSTPAISGLPDDGGSKQRWGCLCSAEGGIKVEPDQKTTLLDLLKGRIPDEEYQKATAMTDEEILNKYPKEVAAATIGKAGEEVKASRRERMTLITSSKNTLLLCSILFCFQVWRTDARKKINSAWGWLTWKVNNSLAGISALSGPMAMSVPGYLLLLVSGKCSGTGKVSPCMTE